MLYKKYYCVSDIPWTDDTLHIIPKFLDGNLNLSSIRFSHNPIICASHHHILDTIVIGNFLKKQAYNPILFMPFFPLLQSSFYLRVIYDLDQLYKTIYTIDSRSSFVNDISFASLVAPIIKNNNNLDDTVIIAPDAGAVKSAQILSKILNVPLAVCIKDRILQRCDLIGHVHACHCVIVDDVVLSGTTLRLCFDTLKSHGAKDISIAIPHLPYTYDWFKDFKMIITTNSCQKLPFSDTCVFIDLKEILNQCLMS